jgi:hypothetical protein
MGGTRMAIGIFIDSVRINGHEQVIKTKDDLRDLQGMINLCLKWMPDETGPPESAVVVTPQAASGNGTAHHLPSKPPVGERTIDYAERAAASFRDYFTIVELHDAMKQMGWKTTSRTRAIAVSAVRQVVKESKKFRYEEQGMWRFLGEPVQQSVQT